MIDSASTVLVRWQILLLLVCSLCLPVLGSAQGSTTTTLRIVAGAPNLVEMVYAVGAGPQLVGVSRFTNWPPEARSLPQVTDLANPNIEAVVALRPTLILTLPSQARLREFFDGRRGVRTVDMGRLETLEEIVAAIRRVGEFTDRRQAGNAVADALVRSIEDLRQQAPHQRRRVLLVLGLPDAEAGPLYCVGRGTYLNELLEVAGGENVLDESHGLYPPLGREALVRLDPDLIVGLVDAVPSEDRRDQIRTGWADFRHMKAVVAPDGFRYAAEPALMIPGPRVLQGIVALRDAIAPAGS